MPNRSEEAAAFFAAAYAAIQEIPRGRVTSYAHIARLIGRRKSSLPSPHNLAFFDGHDGMDGLINDMAFTQSIHESMNR